MFPSTNPIIEQKMEKTVGKKQRNAIQTFTKGKPLEIQII